MEYNIEEMEKPEITGRFGLDISIKAYKTIHENNKLRELRNISKQKTESQGWTLPAGLLNVFSEYIIRMAGLEEITG